MKTRTLGIIYVIAIMLTVAVTPALAGDWQKALEENLKAEYPVTKIGISALRFNYNRITEPGGVFVVRIPGIYADMAGTKQAIIKTSISDGKAVQQKGFLASLSNTNQARELKPGENVYILGVKVKSAAIEFELLTEDITPFDGLETRFRSQVVFPLAELATMKTEDVKKVVNVAFALPAVANATESKTIQLGMSGEEVKKILGNPDKVVELGAKTIYVYKDMKVILNNQKVADVQ
jgi:hypothetical protein